MAQLKLLPLMRAECVANSGKIIAKYKYLMFVRATCLDHNNPDSHDGQRLSSFICHGQGGNQYFMYTKLNEIRQSGDHEMCLTVQSSVGMPDTLAMSRLARKCHSTY